MGQELKGDRGSNMTRSGAGVQRDTGEVTWEGVHGLRGRWAWGVGLQDLVCFTAAGPELGCSRVGQ